MRRQSLSARVERTGNVRGEICRLDRELKRRPPTTEELGFLQAVVEDDVVGDLQVTGHAERVYEDAVLKWDLDEGAG